jgi:DNA-binding NtrC family response regulator
VDVRLIAATHRNVKQLVAEGRFREDLYYRLAGYEIAVPPLRERRSDIPLLVEHFRRREGNVPGPSRAVLDVLAAHGWPGNVRELEQVIRRTVIDSGGLTDDEAATRAIQTIAPTANRQLPTANSPESSADELVPLDEAEKKHIMNVLRATAGNQTQAAFILGIERKTLARKIKRYGIKS